MTEVRNIINAMRTAAAWLVVVSVFLGPVVLGGSFAFAATSKTCGESCPCDEAAHDDHGESSTEDPCADEADGTRPEAGAPCDEECPDNCPNCSCCPGVAMAVVPVTIPSSLLASSSARMQSPPHARASGACTGIFRPPRSVT